MEKIVLGDKFKLTKKEEEILKVLWNAERPLTIAEICEYARGIGIVLKLNSVQAMVTRLLNRGLVKVEGTVLVNTVYARSFLPTLTSDSYLAGKMLNTMQEMDGIEPSDIVARLLRIGNFSRSQLDELSNVINGIKA